MPRVTAEPCGLCGGSGLVVVHFDGEVEAWPAWLAKVEVVGEGFPPSASATGAGLVRPVPCGRVACREGGAPC